MIWIGCPNCKQEATHKYLKEFSIKSGFTNPTKYFVSCVGSNDNMMKIVQARQNAKLLEDMQHERSKAVSKLHEQSKAVSKLPFLQQTLSAFNFIPSESILSIDMWITKIGEEEHANLQY